MALLGTPRRNNKWNSRNSYQARSPIFPRKNYSNWIQPLSISKILQFISKRYLWTAVKVLAHVQFCSGC